MTMTELLTYGFNLLSCIMTGMAIGISAAIIFVIVTMGRE
jgi:hypothetical protein